MPRMPKKLKLEWSFFINALGRRSYNSLCRQCVHPCKQSHRVIVIACRKYISKRSIANVRKNR